PEDARQYLLTAQQQLSRVANITRKTLGFYRDTSPATWIDVDKVMDEVLFIYGGLIAARNLDLRKRYADKELRVFTNAGELRQVLSNLVGNAIDASAPAGYLCIRIAPALRGGGPGVRFLVADEGEGISVENLPRVFAPFFSTKQDTGTGLGLWVSRGIVNKHGGTIRFRSRVKKGRSGTVFTVFWPREGASVVCAVPPEGDAAAA
ncbi:MAG: HAMP domain-containing sensor histidine kinase, partial [Terriglobales bacterium]